MRPWVHPDAIPASAGNVATRSWAVDAATRALYRLSGRRWIGAGEVGRVAIRWPRRHPSRFVSAMYAHGAVSPTVGQLAANWGPCEPPVVLLPDHPVTQILEPAGCTISDGVRVERAAGWPEQTVITYLYGADPPADGAAAAAILATELALGRTGDPTCRLPRRVTNITRQGVTMTMLDPLDLFDAGRTGIPEVDAWLGTVNPRRITAAPPWAWSPDLPYPRRIPLGFRFPSGVERRDLHATAGDPLDAEFRWVDQAGALVDTTGATGRVRVVEEDGTTLLDSLTGPGGTDLAWLAPGILALALAPVLTATLPALTAYEISVDEGSGYTSLAAGLLVTSSQPTP